METERYDTVVIGGGQAGLAVGYHLAKAGRPFVILDANERVGDVWRKRWDSLRVFTPAMYDGLPGMKFPAKGWSFPTKDQIADYFETYAARFALPVRTGIRATRVAKVGQRFVVETTGPTFEAPSVVVATGMLARPHIPDFALDLDPRILQLHSVEYRNPATLRPGGVLVVGAGNSGAEIALDVARTHRTMLSGRLERMKIGPSRSRVIGLVAWQVLSHIMTIRTPIGRKVKAKMAGHHGRAPVERVRPQDLAAAGVELVPRTEAVRDGRPVLADGRVADVANVIWCTGYRPDLGWIDLPIIDEHGEPRQTRGVSEVEGLYFVGRFFQYAFTSLLIGGVGRDASYIARHIAARAAVRAGEALPHTARA